MAYKIDRRVEKTKKLLKESLLDILKSTELTAISIKDLCIIAGVNRTTFYKHYKSQFELLAEIENDFLQSIEDKFITSAQKLTPSEGFTQVLEYMKSNRDLVTLLMANDTDSVFEKRLMTLPTVIQRMNKNSTDSSENVTYSFNQLFILDGAYCATKRWLDEGCTKPPATLAQEIGSISQRIWILPQSQA